MFNNTALEVIFKKKFRPVNGAYKFQITECLVVDGKELYPNYIRNVPAEFVEFVETGVGFLLSIEDSVFADLVEKSKTLCREIYVYPKFGE